MGNAAGDSKNSKTSITNVVVTFHVTKTSSR